MAGVDDAGGIGVPGPEEGRLAAGKGEACGGAGEGDAWSGAGRMGTDHGDVPGGGAAGWDPPGPPLGMIDLNRDD